MEPKVPNIDPEVAALSPFTIPAVVGINATGSEDAEFALEMKIRERALEEDGGKFSKPSAHYVPTKFPTFFYEYKCETCRFYNEAAGTCDVVGQSDDPLGGEKVHDEAWCAVWMPEEDRGAFDWAKERLNPE